MQSADAQLWLFMPAETPQPTDPASTGRSSPQYERRHHYVWALEDRQVASRQMYARSDESYRHEFAVTTDRFW